MSTYVATTFSRRSRTGVMLRVVGALALGFSAFLHFKIAFGAPPFLDDGGVTLMGLFVAQAVAATLVAVGVLIWGNRLSWLAFLLLAAASLAALVVSTYVTIPSIGPLPEIHDPIWFTDKVLAAVAAGVATLVAIAALATSRRTS